MNYPFIPSFFSLRRLFLPLVLLAVVPFSQAAAGAEENIFVNKCGKCHHLGGQAEPVNPADKAGLVWVKYFKRQRHPINLNDKISAAEMQAILLYLQDHAADSERPIAAAIPK